MRTVLMAVLGFVVGAAGAVLLMLAGYITFTTVTDYSDFEGATAMGMASISPFVGLVGGIIGAFVLARITRPRKPV